VVKETPIVIASEAKQSRRLPRKQSGSLRRFAPRNDETYKGGSRYCEGIGGGGGGHRRRGSRQAPALRPAIIQ
jgi:hypothetical protein